MRKEDYMECSKISSIEVHNFMSYKYAKAVFDERGIINLKGYNNSGKTAFQMALVICLMNSFASKQGKYIHHGEKYFRVIVNFDDGVSIVKDKYDNGQSLYEMYEEGVCVFTTKQGNKLAKVTGVPTPIKQYLDLIDTETGYLNYQTRREPLWLIETLGSENYSTLNEVLKTEEISRANAMLNSDVNSLNSEIVTIESELQRKQLQLQACKGVSRELIDALSDKEDEVKVIMAQDDALIQMKKSIDALLGVRVPCELGGINSTKLKYLEQLGNTYRELSTIKIPCEMENVAINKLKAVTSLSNTVSSEDLSTDIGIELSTVDCDKQRSLSVMFKGLKEAADALSVLSKLEKEEEKLIAEKAEFVESAKQQGKIFVECENCGTLMEVNTNES